MMSGGLSLIWTLTLTEFIWLIVKKKKRRAYNLIKKLADIKRRERKMSKYPSLGIVKCIDGVLIPEINIGNSSFYEISCK